MTYRQFLKEYVTPYLKDNDKPFNRQLFNDTLDFCLKDGILSKKAETWVYPKTKMFE